MATTKGMAEYLRPSTLFRPSHFEEYLAAAISWNDNGRKRTEGEKLARNKAIAAAGSKLYDQETPELREAKRDEGRR